MLVGFYAIVLRLGIIGVNRHDCVLVVCLCSIEEQSESEMV